MKERGITLVALIITIIILIILVGITIKGAIDSGIIKLGIEGTEKYVEEQKREVKLFNNIYDVIKNAISGEKGNLEQEALPELVLSIDDITSNSFRINITNDYPQNVQYTYYLNGEKIKDKTNEKTCYVENLEDDTTYEVKVIANIGSTIKESNVSVTTKIDLEKETLLLFDNGKTYSDVTGGWHGGYTDGTTAENGKIDISNLLTIDTWGTWTGYTIQTRKAIDMSNYSQIVFEIETDTALDATSWRTANFGITDSNTLANIRTVSTHVSYDPTTTLSKAIYDIPKSDESYNKNYYVWFYACNGRKISVSKIYLSKTAEVEPEEPKEFIAQIKSDDRSYYSYGSQMELQIVYENDTEINEETIIKDQTIKINNKNGAEAKILSIQNEQNKLVMQIEVGSKSGEFEIEIDGVKDKNDNSMILQDSKEYLIGTRMQRVVKEAKAVAGNVYNSYVPENALDDNFDTFLQFGGYSGTLEINFKNSQEINKVSIWTGASPASNANIIIYGLEGENWKTIKNFNTNLPNTRDQFKTLVEIDVEHGLYNGIRVALSYPNSWVGLSEVNIE